VTSQLRHLKNAIALEVEEAFINAQVARAQIELFQKEILKEAEEVYQMMLFLIEARKAYAEALYNYALALATLEKSIGQNL